MSVDIVLVHLALTLAFFLILNWIGAHAYSYGYMQMSILHRQDESPMFNLMFRILAPLVFIVIVSAVFYWLGWDRLNDRVYFVVIYYGVFKILFNAAVGRFLLINWRRELFLLCITSLLSWLLYEKLIRTKVALLPDLKTLADQLWITVIMFVFMVANTVRTAGTASAARHSNYLARNFRRFQSQYEAILSGLTKNERLKALVYAIMIFENFNRPRLVRGLERFFFSLGARPMTLGVMQVRTNEPISDEESVRLGARKIIGDWEQGMRKDYPRFVAANAAIKDEDLRRKFAKRSVIDQVIGSYNGGSAYRTEIIELYSKILHTFYPNIKVDAVL